MIVGTVAVSLIVVTVAGWWLAGRIADQLTDSRAAAAVTEAQAGFAYAQQHLDASIGESGSPSVEDLNDVVESLAGRRGAGGRFDVVLEGPLGAGRNGRTIHSSAEPAVAALPERLVHEIASSRGTYWTFTELSEADGTVPGVAVGGQVHIPGNGGTYAMYYLFSLADQDKTLGFVRWTLALGGLVLVLLLGSIAWFLSRRTLAPIRLARRAADRYGSGRLEQRMYVKGDDEVAGLSMSFNQMAASLQSQIRRLEELSRTQRRFVVDVADQLSAPLAAVAAATESLRDRNGELDPEICRTVERLEAELEHLEALLFDLSELSRFDAGLAVLDIGIVDLVDIAEHAASRIGARQPGTKIVVDYDGPVLVEADAHRVDRIVAHLLTNAVEHSGSERIEVRVAHTEDAATLAVRDFGEGLSPGDVRRVFLRFWRKNPSHARGGTGLGLSIARKDAELHGGALKSWSAPGRGAQFVLTLPLRHAEPPASAPIRSGPKDSR